jgi:AcrR family transcriptional regulator
MISGRKKTIEGVDTRERLLRAAEQLIAEHGYDAVSTRMIHKGCGVNIAMISYYFGSKEGLFRALIEEKVPKIREKLEVLRDSDQTPWEKLSNTIDLYVDRLFENIKFTKVMGQELSINARPENSDFIVKHIHLNMVIILSFFKEGIEKGDFKSNIDVEMTLSSIFAIIFQWINMSAIGMKLFQMEDKESVYCMEYRDRLKRHLIEMMRSHLLVNPSLQQV